MNALLIFYNEQPRTGKWRFGQFRSSGLIRLKAQLWLKGYHQNPMSALLKSIQKRRQALLGRCAFEALVEEPGQQTGVALEKLSVYTMLRKQAQWTTLSTTWRQPSGELRRGNDFFRRPRQPQATLSYQQRMVRTVYVLDQIFESSELLADRRIIGRSNPFRGLRKCQRIGKEIGASPAR